VSGATLIQIDGLEKQFPVRNGQRLTALTDINLTVPEGEFLSVVGPSGCGKSTLMRILAGVLGYTGGSAAIRGEAITGPRRDIGVVFQQPVLMPWRTVLHNVMLPAEIQGKDPARAKERAERLLAMVGLADFAGQYPFELSGGMQQRVSICRALVHDPAILLMDEPFGALDAMTREQLNLDLLHIWETEHKTIVFITHSIPEAILLGDRVVVMTPRPGRIASVLNVDLPRPRSLELMSTPRFGEMAAEVRALLGTASKPGGSRVYL